MKNIALFFIFSLQCLFAQEPKEWSLHATGVVSHIENQDNIYLTLDACTRGFDKDLIDFLIAKKIPATLFVTQIWIKNEPEAFAFLLAHQDIFQIENHGYHHKPLSINGKSAYGIPGTKNLADIDFEVNESAKLLAEQTGKAVRFFRPGTAFCDEIAVQAVRNMGFAVLGFSINGDFGGTASAEQVYENLKQSKKGDIILLHFNRPKGGTRAGLIRFLNESDLLCGHLP